MGLMPSSIALLFPGQGSHAEGMDEPYRGHPLFERGLELLGYDPFDSLTTGTRYQQPALFLVSVAAWDEWRREPPEDDAGEAIAAAGHSLGEYAALVAAGALEFDDAVKLVDERADAMAAAGEERPGGMIAMLGGESRDVRAELAENLLRPVRWRETLLALRTAGAERFVELGPGAVLTGLVKRTLAAA